jgi:hypothetical protein
MTCGTAAGTCTGAVAHGDTFFFDTPNTLFFLGTRYQWRAAAQAGNIPGFVKKKRSDASYIFFARHKRTTNRHPAPNVKSSPPICSALCNGLSTSSLMRFSFHLERRMRPAHTPPASQEKKAALGCGKGCGNLNYLDQLLGWLGQPDDSCG